MIMYHAELQYRNLIAVHNTALEQTDINQDTNKAPLWDHCVLVIHYDTISFSQFVAPFSER